MSDVYRKLYQLLSASKNVCLATITGKTGSGPQVPGSKMLFRGNSIVAGTLGGGIMEADAAQKVRKALKTKKADWYSFSLDKDISEKNAAICGGKTNILIDPAPEKHLAVFRKINEDLSAGKEGILLSYIKRLPCGSISIDRQWHSYGENPVFDDSVPVEIREKIILCFRERTSCIVWKNKAKDKEEAFFTEPVSPAPRLIIAGAGHIGKALTHLASLLDFDITVIDGRPEHANFSNLPDAGKIIIADPGQALSQMHINENTYIVIVTRGHHEDTEALKSCINRPATYIGMIGSRRKIRLMKEKFISEGWTDPMAWEKIHAPVGMDIGAESIQEIALSIAAELVKVQKQQKKKSLPEKTHAIILAAGESRRMGRPKMLLPFGNHSIIETLITNIRQSSVDSLSLIAGANRELLMRIAEAENVPVVVNGNYREGMLSSVISGLNHVPDGTRNIMIFLGDQPMIQPELINDLIREKQLSKKGIVLPVYKGRRGHPLLIDIRYRNEIRTLNTEEGLRALLINHPQDIHEMESEHDYILRDIDTSEDYERELGEV